MRITLIDASPRPQNSTSGKLLNILKSNFETTAEVYELKLCSQALSDKQKQIVQESDCTVFIFPLYVDGIPGHLLSCLLQLEAEQLMKPHSAVYGIVNCGFYEAIQTETALQVLENWCNKTASFWCGGLGIGGGGAIAYLAASNFKQGPLASIWKELSALAEHIKTGHAVKNRYTHLKLPRFLYKLAAQMSWHSMIKSNGLKKSDLGRRL